MSDRSAASPVRIAVATLGLSMAGFIGLTMKEGYTDKAVIPTKGDVPTIGFGSTVHEDGRRVQMGDTITPVRALRTAQAHINRDETQFRASLPGVSLTQGEYDLYLDFTYQYGIGNWRSSSMRRRLLETRTATPAQLPGLYRAACDALLAWKKQAGRDCSLPQNWGPKGCKGVWTRQQERHAKCLAEQVAQ